MTEHPGRTAPVVLAALVLVGAANLAAYAANGKPLLLGKANTPTKSTKVTNAGSGPALSLQSKPSAPPLSVSSSKLVTRLNADRVDGLDGSQLRTAAYTYTLPRSEPATSVSFAFPGLPAGTYQASYSVQASFPGPATLTCGLRLADADPYLGYVRLPGDGSMSAAGVAVSTPGPGRSRSGVRPRRRSRSIWPPTSARP